MITHLELNLPIGLTKTSASLCWFDRKESRASIGSRSVYWWGRSRAAIGFNQGFIYVHRFINLYLKRGCWELEGVTLFFVPANSVLINALNTCSSNGGIDLGQKESVENNGLGFPKASRLNGGEIFTANTN